MSPGLPAVWLRCHLCMPPIQQPCVLTDTLHGLPRGCTVCGTNIVQDDACDKCIAGFSGNTCQTRCSRNTYSLGDGRTCSSCVGGSTSNSGNTGCVCDDPQLTWDASSNSCLRREHLAVKVQGDSRPGWRQHMGPPATCCNLAQSKVATCRALHAASSIHPLQAQAQAHPHPHLLGVSTSS
jgi:hypothetical protein